MKNLFFSLAALSLIATSCATDVKDSTSQYTFTEYNIIEDIQTPSANAIASQCSYKWNYNITRQVVDISTTDIIIDNHKVSFETDTMAIKPIRFGEKISYMGFSSSSNIGKGAVVTDLNGYIPACFVPTSTNIFSSTYKFEYGQTSRLMLQYNLNEQYRVTTVWNAPCYVGQTRVAEDGNTFSTKDTGYLVQIDFTKKTADVFVLGLDLGLKPEEKAPKVVLINSVPVTMTHGGYYLEASSPKTTIPGIVDNKSTFVETTDYTVSDFSLQLLSSDMTDAQISYNIKGKKVDFIGCSILKSQQ
ncbi:MAG: hypothetical protein K2J58_05815 [Muribaculaceae bacterium]|nr:hypothetical protein [Muribaculaceae bacterium]